MMKKVLLVAIATLLLAFDKTPSEVFSHAMVVKQYVELLREQEGVKEPFPKVPPQTKKFPRHVIQKALEILNRINLYRIKRGYGEITIPPYPARDITPNDVYSYVLRVEDELRPFIDPKRLEQVKFVQYTGKTPNDVYQLLWSISLAFNPLLGVYGYTPTDVYAISLKLIDIVKFLRQSQNIYEPVQKPQKRPNLNPNHALYASYDFLAKVKRAEQNLWMEPTEVPKKPQRVITPTDVYDSVQYDIAELQRIKYRLGIERYFKEKSIKEAKTPSDVVQNLEYAKALMPLFSFDRKLIQYPQKSLQKTPSHVFAVTQEVLKKVRILKGLKGISQKAKPVPYIEDLKPIHAYQKGIEATEKALRLKVQMGFFPSEVPVTPLRAITPNEVYELVIRLDQIVTLLLKKAGYETIEYLYKVNKEIPQGKKPSDVYHNLWKISSEFDVLLAGEYTPNEVYALAKRLQRRIEYILKRLHIKQSAIERLKKRFTTTTTTTTTTKTPKDVLILTNRLFDEVKKIQERLNLGKSQIIIPQSKDATPDDVYNALRIINAGVNEIIIALGVRSEAEEVALRKRYKATGKTPTDVYLLVKLLIEESELLYDEASYQN